MRRTSKQLRGDRARHCELFPPSTSALGRKDWGRCEQSPRPGESKRGPMACQSSYSWSGRQQAWRSVGVPAVLERCWRILLSFLPLSRLVLHPALACHFLVGGGANSRGLAARRESLWATLAPTPTQRTGQAVGLPLASFRTPMLPEAEQARNPAWRVEPGGGRSRRSTRSALVLLALMLLLITLLLGGGVVVVTIPHATVVLIPREEERSLSLVYSVSSRPEPLDWVAPTRSVTVTVEASSERPASGKKEVPEGWAAGSVRFVNATLRSFTIAAGQELLGSNGVSYRVREATVVPAADPFGSQAFGVADVPVEATEVGPVGNAEPGVVAGELAPGLLYRNLQPLTGGYLRTLPVVTEEDRQQAGAEAVAKLRALLPRALESALGEREVLVLDTPQLGPPVLTYSAEVGAEVEKVVAQAVATATALAYQPGAVHRAAEEEAVRRLLQTLEPEAVLLGQTLTVSPPKSLASERWQVTVQATVRLLPGREWLAGLPGQLAGRRLTEAEQLVSRAGSVAEARIELEPRWWLKRLPDRPEQINVVVEDRGAGPRSSRP